MGEDRNLVDKYELSERDICTKFITPAILQAGWAQHQFREEVNLTDGRVVVRGNLAALARNPERREGPNVPTMYSMRGPIMPFERLSTAGGTSYESNTSQTACS